MSVGLTDLQKGLGDHKLLKLVARQAPLTHRMFFGRRYILPNYRQADYTPQAFENWIANARKGDSSGQ